MKVHQLQVTTFRPTKNCKDVWKSTTKICVCIWKMHCIFSSKHFQGINSHADFTSKNYLWKYRDKTCFTLVLLCNEASSVNNDKYLVKRITVPFQWLALFLGLPHRRFGCPMRLREVLSYQIQAILSASLLIWPQELRFQMSALM